MDFKINFYKNKIWGNIKVGKEKRCDKDVYKKFCYKT